MNDLRNIDAFASGVNYTVNEISLEMVKEAGISVPVVTFPAAIAEFPIWTWDEERAAHVLTDEARKADEDRDAMHNQFEAWHDVAYTTALDSDNEEAPAAVANVDQLFAAEGIRFG